MIFWKINTYFYIYFKNDVAVYIARNAYFDTIKGIKICRVLPVDFEFWNLATSIYMYYFGKKSENYKFLAKS